MTVTMADIDALLSLPKTIFDAPDWVEEGNRATLRADLVHQGNVQGGVWVILSANIHTDPQRGDCVLIFDGKPIQRLSYMPKGAHANPRVHPAPPRLRLVTLPPEQSRIYLWQDNRSWPPPAQMAGEVLVPQPVSFADAITVFLAACCISGDVPPAPWRPTML